MLHVYLEYMVAVFDEVLRVLSPSGVLWLNAGDTAAGSGGAGGDYRPGGSRSGDLRYRQGASGLNPRQWCDVPWRLVHRLQEHGWLLRSTVVWDKARTKREDLAHAKRPGEQWEPIFMLAPAAANKYRLAYDFDASRMSELGNVWHFPPDHDAEHPCVFPGELVRRCLEPLPAASSLLDPFAGTGTALAAATGSGLSATGIDLDPANADRAQAKVGMFLTVETAPRRDSPHTVEAPTRPTEHTEVTDALKATA